MTAIKVFRIFDVLSLLLHFYCRYFYNICENCKNVCTFCRVMPICSPSFSLFSSPVPLIVPQWGKKWGLMGRCMLAQGVGRTWRYEYPKERRGGRKKMGIYRRGHLLLLRPPMMMLFVEGEKGGNEQKAVTGRLFLRMGEMPCMYLCEHVFCCCVSRPNFRPLFHFTFRKKEEKKSVFTA